MTTDPTRTKRPPKPPVLVQDESGAVGPPDAAGKAAIMEAMGTSSPHLTAALVQQLSNALRLDETSPLRALNAALAMVTGIGPRDELEAGLAVQMVTCHHLAMEYSRRAMLSNQTYEGEELYSNRAAKLMSLYTIQMQALRKYRSKGDQHVRVEHVHVHDGGQAVVGDVHAGSGGDG